MAEVFEFTALERPAFLVEDSASAEERAAARQAEAQHLGHQEGLERGMAEARMRVEQALEAVAAAERALAEMHDRYVADAEAAAVDLAFQIAEKVIGTTIATDREAVLGVVSGALLRTTDRDHLVLEVNPGDFELVRDSAAALAARLGGINRMEVVSERRVEAGGCVVRTEAGEIDA
ncbi:MAG TPA: FliH/SctL family protein, partial [Gaiellales bacterium]|nr:FliH/SctL family protein [Gaiellales bacterium]